jgi:hypothetical protein
MCPGRPRRRGRPAAARRAPVPRRRGRAELPGLRDDRGHHLRRGDPAGDPRPRAGAGRGGDPAAARRDSVGGHHSERFGPCVPGVRGAALLAAGLAVVAAGVAVDQLWIVCAALVPTGCRDRPAARPDDHDGALRSAGRAPRPGVRPVSMLRQAGGILGVGVMEVLVSGWAATPGRGPGRAAGRARRGVDGAGRGGGGPDDHPRGLLMQALGEDRAGSLGQCAAWLRSRVALRHLRRGLDEQVRTHSAVTKRR